MWLSCERKRNTCDIEIVIISFSLPMATATSNPQFTGCLYFIIDNKQWYFLLIHSYRHHCIKRPIGIMLLAPQFSCNMEQTKLWKMFEIFLVFLNELWIFCVFVTYLIFSISKVFHFLGKSIFPLFSFAWNISILIHFTSHHLRIWYVWVKIVMTLTLTWSTICRHLQSMEGYQRMKNSHYSLMDIKWGVIDAVNYYFLFSYNLFFFSNRIYWYSWFVWMFGEISIIFQRISKSQTESINERKNILGSSGIKEMYTVQKPFFNSKELMFIRTFPIPQSLFLMCTPLMVLWCPSKKSI